MEEIKQARTRAAFLGVLFEAMLKSFKRGWECGGKDSEVSSADLVSEQECWCLSVTEQGAGWVG